MIQSFLAVALQHTLMTALSATTPVTELGSSSIAQMLPTLLIISFGSLSAGMLQRHLRKRRRTALLGQFVAPNVAGLIAREGASAITSDAQNDISVVCVDIRQYTRFAEVTPSPEVMAFLRDYYEAVGQAVGRFGGTVKDYAGDGIVILVGAPRPLADHAERARNMALAIRSAVEEVTQRWSKGDQKLGVGVGVASGRVTLGLIGGTERIEFAAVGPAVNLAARLCSKAKAGQILLCERTQRLAPATDGTRQRALSLKGMAEPVTSFAL